MKKSSIKKLNYPYNSNSICGAQLCLIGISNNVTHSCLLLLDEVAVIDEIQMIRDQQRGWAWTRSLLGLCAHEIHTYMWGSQCYRSCKGIDVGHW